MTADGFALDEAAEALLQANRSFTPMAALHTRGPLSLAGAYQIQERVFDALWGPASIAGYKISLVAPEHRAAFGADEPTFGRLSPAQIIEGAPTLRVDSMHCPLVEPELVFLLEEDLSPGATPDEVRKKSRVAAGFEVPDSRYQGWHPVPDQTVGDLVADNSFAGVVVHSSESVAATALDLAAVVVTMTIDDEVVGTGTGESVMGDPANTVSWLSGALARNGQILRAGMRISAGTFHWPPAARPGVFRADYDGVGSVSITFS